MHPFLAFLLRTFIAIPVTAATWLISYFAFEQTFLISSGTAVVSGAVMYSLVKGYTNSKYLKSQRLTRKEYRYIKKNLVEAKSKITRLNKALFSVRNIASIKQNIDIIRVVRKIYSITKKEPKRFYQAERFYFHHLDSMVELTEKYAFLSQQPKKSLELDETLLETRRMIKELSQSLENDLYHVLENDIDQLNFEIDVVKHSVKNEQPIDLDESRRIK